VQPLLVWRAREAEDLTWDKSDPKERSHRPAGCAVVLLRAGTHQRGAYARLRHLGARRNQLTTAATTGVQQLRDLLECVWPAVLDAAGAPFRSATWCAALAVVLDRCVGDLTRVRRLGAARFLAAVRAELPRWNASRPRFRIVTAVFDALTDPTGVIVHRPGALQRTAMILHDWHNARARLAETEAAMVTVIDELDLTNLVTSIPGLSAVGAAAILAETGDLTRFPSPRSVVKHAGLCPRDNASGHHHGKTTISGRGRPELRLAAWRAVWAALLNNTVLKGRFAHLTTRQANRLAPLQARNASERRKRREDHRHIDRTRGSGVHDDNRKIPPDGTHTPLRSSAADRSLRSATSGGPTRRPVEAEMSAGGQIALLSSVEVAPRLKQA
jgi:hypothetical protein